MDVDSPDLRTVLLVDDDPNDRLIVRNAFERAAPGIRLRMCIDGEEAIDYLSGHGEYSDRMDFPLPDVVLLDLKLPRKSGFEVLEWMRERPEYRQVSAIILSSSQERSDIDLAFALGANCHLVKEVDIKALRGVVRGIGVYAALVSRRQPGCP
jgi:CheY-like chemotaxis protein